MSHEPPSPQPPVFAPPVSSFGGPVAELIAQEMLAPPARPGLLATLNQFEIQRVLGSGGMGIVLLARDANTGRNVAIKLVRPELVANQQAIHRFVKEAGHLQKLKHPAVIPVLEVSDRPAGPYFVMPYYERGSLAGRIRPGQPLDAVFILDIALGVAGGLQFAHRRGIIHRDLKPANILLADEARACLADFGLARSLFNDTIVDVEHQQCEGTAPYLSPGVAAGNAEDTRCDIYAFGALLYEMLTGEPPYAGRTLQEIRRQILDGPPKPVRERNPRADDGLTAVAEGAMARELRDRYADMTDVVADLQRIKDGKPPVGPRGLVRGSLRQVRRIPTLAWLTAGVIVVSAVTALLLESNDPSRRNRNVPPVPATNPPIVVVKIPRVTTNPPTVVVPTPPAIQPKWTATIFAGQPGAGGSADGTGGDARFLAPGGVAVDQMGNVYVADTGNHTIRKITPAGAVTTLAGQAGRHGSLDSLDGPGGAARFFAPFGISIDNVGRVDVSEMANGTIRVITPAGEVSTLAGLAGNPGSHDGRGDNAQFRNPFSVTVDSHGNLYVADTSNSAIRKITPLGAVSTLAGRAGNQGANDGPARDARFSYPHGVAVDRAGIVYVADTANSVIRKITPDGMVSTLAGRAGSPGLADGARDAAQFRNPQSLAVDKAGHIYVADAGNLAVRMVTADGAVTTLPAVGELGHPDAVAVDAAGNLYLADTVNNVIRKLTPSDGAGLR